MQRVILAASAAAIALAAVPALAQTAPGAGAYAGLGYSQTNDHGTALGAVQGRLGYKFTPNLGVEGEGSLGVDTDKVRSPAGVPTDTKISHSVAAYGVGTLPVTDRLDLFARAGYGTTKLKDGYPAGTYTEHGDSFNYGVGAQYFIDGQNGVRADYTRKEFRHDRGGSDVWGVSYVRRF